MKKDDILNIISKHTVGVGRAKTLEKLAELENNTVDKLYTLFSLHGVVFNEATINNEGLLDEPEPLYKDYDIEVKSVVELCEHKNWIRSKERFKQECLDCGNVFFG